jgi:hypothetical protein
MTARSCVAVVTLVSASTIAACSSNAATGPSSASLAQFFDSAFVADSAAGYSADPRAIVEAYLALMADEGLTPVPVHVVTDGGTLPMQMMAAVSYDTTATGLAADSVALVVGWTSDYSKYLVLVTEAFTRNGPRVGSAGVASGRLPVLASSLSGDPRTARAETAIASLAPFVLVVDGESVVGADTATGDISWSGGATGCAWQHVPLARHNADSTLACSRVTVTLDFAFHLVGETDADTSLTHLSMSSHLIPAVRLVGFNGF